MAVPSATEHGGLWVQLQFSGIKFQCRFLRNRKQAVKEVENQISQINQDNNLHWVFCLLCIAVGDKDTILEYS